MFCKCNINVIVFCLFFVFVLCICFMEVVSFKLYDLQFCMFTFNVFVQIIYVVLEWVKGYGMKEKDRKIFFENIGDGNISVKIVANICVSQ